MRHRYAFWASATAVIAVAVLVGCAGDDDDANTGGIVSGGVGGLPPTGGTVAPGAGGGGSPVAPPMGTAGASAGTGGATPPAAGAGAGGAGGQPTAGAGTAGAGSGGMGGEAGSMGGAGGSTPPAATGTCGPATTISAADLGDPMKRGPWMPTMKASSGPSGSSTLYYPMELGKDGVKHPVFHWGCGAGSTPSQYNDHLNLLASHGFVVIANASGSGPGKASLDWILAENEKSGSVFYQKLDPMRVGTGGHSLGALETFQYADDPRLQLYVLVCGGASGGTGAADIHGPSIFLGGEGEGGTVNFEGDYAEVSKAPSVFVTKTNTGHVPCARNNLGPWVAFMRWNFCGEEAQWKKEFMPDGTYCKAPWLACKTKGLM